MTDESYMKRALKLAEKGCGFVNPNPMVGAVIVKNGKIIGEGYHEKYGELHAERNALLACSESPKGATMYVTLEPCCHQGKTPPCTEAVIENQVARVVVGSKDPNPIVGGKGIQLLKAHGIEVAEGILEEECNQLNQIFFHYIQTRTPYVIMKYAMTMDGKIAAYTGSSKWVTGEIARNRVQEDRHRYMGIMVGVQTVLTDDSMLNCRLPGKRDPVRIICDTNLRTPLNAQIVTTAKQVRTILATACEDKAHQEQYLERGCEILVVDKKDGRVDLSKLMQHLGGMGIDSILLEGGASLNWSALENGIVHKVQTYLAPKLVGGVEAKSPIGGAGIAEMNQAVRLSPPKVTILGDDILLESEVIRCSRES